LKSKRRFGVKAVGARPRSASRDHGSLGFHTDELYYIDSGWHLALGYVDFRK
jgi:hypothetical protein